jgi:hypothetical protein
MRRSPEHTLLTISRQQGRCNLQSLSLIVRTLYGTDGTDPIQKYLFGHF